MPATYEPIATASTYTDLVLVMNIFTSANANQTVTVNGSSTGYSTTLITGNGSTAASARYTNNNSFNIQYNIFAGSSEPAFHIMQFQNYANTTTMVNVLGAGQVTFAQGSGVTITSTGATASAPKLRARYSACTVICTASNTFTIVGDLA